MTPWLLEVNHTPSFTTDSPLDIKIKTAVVKDALVLLNLSASHKKVYQNRLRRELQERTMTRRIDKTRFSLDSQLA